MILDGAVETLFHENKSRLPRMMGKYGPGDIIGADWIDRGISSHSESWNLCLCATEVIWMDRETFHELWHFQDTHKSKILYEVLKSYSIFREMTDQTLYLMAFELI